MANATLSTKLNRLRYSLCRIGFDPETGSFGNRIDTIIDAALQRKSVSFPRPSYDGRYLCYTLSDYGQFSIWHHEADLWLLDLTTGESRPMIAANSDDTESFHNWSTNSRWLVLSSRRDDGLYTRPYFCHVDAEGNVCKAFMLPQRNPRRFYRDRFFSFNVPDFVISPTRFDGREASRIINDEYRKDFGVRKEAASE
jgi:dipeptidyl aminopeptidase/acylaminoacyl peptidase